MWTLDRARFHFVDVLKSKVLKERIVDISLYRDINEKILERPFHHVLRNEMLYKYKYASELWNLSVESFKDRD